MAALEERYSSEIAGVLSCFDRVIVQGTLPKLCYAEGMASYLKEQDVRLFDYPRWAEPLRDMIRENAERMAAEEGVEIEFMRKTSYRKDDHVARVLEKRGKAPGLVCILSAMESCPSYRPWHDKKTHVTMLKPTTGHCLHYYFYFMDPELGLCHLRVPTWAPFRLQFCFNGHNQLAAKLQAAGIEYSMMDNAFATVSDMATAQHLADAVDVARLQAVLDRYAKQCCPPVKTLEHGYHWSLMQVEYSTDIIFRRQAVFQPLYAALSHTAIHAVKPDHVATFLGRKLTDAYAGELGNNFSTRIEGTRIKHHMGPASIKMYDKFGLILRVETTANDVSFFKHHRRVEQKDGTTAFKLAPVRKTIYSLPDLRELLAAANRRYIEFLSGLDDPSRGARDLPKVSEPRQENGRTYRGINFFSSTDLEVVQAVARGENTISGFRARQLRTRLPYHKPGWISRCLKRLRVHGLIKRVGRTYKYYLTDLGKRVIAAGLALRELLVIPALAGTK